MLALYSFLLSSIFFFHSYEICQWNFKMCGCVCVCVKVWNPFWARGVDQKQPSIFTKFMQSEAFSAQESESMQCLSSISTFSYSLPHVKLIFRKFSTVFIWKPIINNKNIKAQPKSKEIKMQQQQQKSLCHIYDLRTFEPIIFFSFLNKKLNEKKYTNFSSYVFMCMCVCVRVTETKA